MRPGFERLLVGRSLGGRYEVLEPIGSGGMSVVFRARDATLGREVALKAVSLAASSERALETLRERFRREAGSAASIQHPNVVQVFDFGTDAELELDFLVMELLRGRDLKEALRDGPPPADEAVRILLHAARGVAAGHRAGIVHRDVKPANVFLVATGGTADAVRVLDFGIAKGLEDDPESALTTVGQLPHSPAYATPEQLDADAPVTAASDVYQLGLVGYELLSGRRPFAEDDRRRIRAGESVPLPAARGWDEAPPAVRAVIERALRPRPADRFPDAGAFAEALEAAGEDGELPPSFAATPDADATELLTATVGVPAAAPPSPEPRPADGVPVRAPAARRRVAVARTPVIWIVPLILLVALAAWLASRQRDDAAPAPVAAAAPEDPEALEDEFLRLQAEAARRSPSPEPPADVDAEPAANAEAGAVTQDFVTEQGRVLEDAVTALNAAWADGDLDAHVAHYADRVDYYDAENLSRDGVRRDRARDLARYDERQMLLHSVDIRFDGTERARVLVDKEWHFAGEGGRRDGRGMQEYVFEREGDGRWYVTSERLLED